MTTTEILWQQTPTTADSGMTYRRYPGVRPDVYAGLRGRSPNQERLIGFTFYDPLPILPAMLTQFRDIRIEWIADPLDFSRRLLLLTLKNHTLLDLFAVLCEDLVAQVADIIDQKQLADILFDRLNRWQLLFGNSRSNKLSAEAQRGLFGELYFLRTLLKSGLDPSRVITAWTGPAGASQDFGFTDVAVEVKTSMAVNPQSFRVSNARQLDDTGLNSLYLLFLSLNPLPDNGETLNQLVEEIDESLALVPAAPGKFRLRLYEAGYFPNHSVNYDSPGYDVLSSSCFLVGKGFPRLCEADLSAGVSELQYSVSLAACAPFGVSEKEILQKLIT